MFFIEMRRKKERPILAVVYSVYWTNER